PSFVSFSSLVSRRRRLSGERPPPDVQGAEPSVSATHSLADGPIVVWSLHPGAAHAGKDASPPSATMSSAGCHPPPLSDSDRIERRHVWHCKRRSARN